MDLYCSSTSMLLVHICFYNLVYVSSTNVLEKDVTREMAYNLW